MNVCKNPDLNLNEIGNQVIWGNKFISDKGKALYFQEWIESGIIHVADLFVNGNFISERQILDKLT